MKPRPLLLSVAVLWQFLPASAQTVFPGADENTPSHSHYFTWINNTNEGATADPTKANLAFFQWLHDEYGMALDIYAFDSGAIDAPELYGSPWFLREVRILHPYEEILGKGLAADGSVNVTVHPFRAVLVLVTSESCAEPSLEKGPYRVVRDVPGADVEIEQLTPLPIKQPWHRKLADLKRGELPANWSGLYEAGCFAADNNALELRSLERSGPSKIPAVNRARGAFLRQPLLATRALSDRYLFDGDPTTVFDTMGPGKDMRISDGCLRVAEVEAIKDGKPIDLEQSQALKITRKTIDGTGYLFIESGGFGPKNPAGWQSPLFVMKSGGKP